MKTMSIKLKAPNGKAIEGTAENVGGVAYCEVSRLEDGTLDIEHEGETEIHWDGQETLSRDGEIIFVDVGGDEWLESELIPEDAVGNPNAKPRPSGSVTRELTLSQLATVLAALRYYQQSGMCEAANRSDGIDDIATDGGTHIALDSEFVDELCEELNFG